ncbi:von Willebrand factor A domain-containing protein 7 [Merluccius polli]|uniref:von Willebrand factor A domain-containing protein 7 n=1 Tax=Merluccius polli TaxID=89951 RepID=A0AA47MXC5_MERPO|nr:von Willebrand factor A domain-containing protein 7 [Merluccius polli]
MTQSALSDLSHLLSKEFMLRVWIRQVWVGRSLGTPQQDRISTHLDQEFQTKYFKPFRSRKASRSPAWIVSSSGNQPNRNVGSFHSTLLYLKSTSSTIMTSTNTSSLLPLVFFSVLLSSVLCFQPLFSLEGSSTHLTITLKAVLYKSAEVCRALASAEGQDFSLTIDNSLTISKTSITNMYLGNAAVDVVDALSKKHHFDDETFPEGRDVITAGIVEGSVLAVKANVKQENFVAGRLILGRVCHTLQDFYSHSNWVELGNRDPYSILIRPDRPLENLADLSVATCQNCINGDCNNNLLTELLTSGYFNILSSDKPAGKCSHGGVFDKTSSQDPVGGINKDDFRASHGVLHHQAAALAVNATIELLEDIRLAVGDKNFLRLMGLSQSSVLCFVIDTRGSMSDDIIEAKRVSFSIIESKKGTKEEPSAYILVPFNDPDVGPLLITTDADVFKARINSLTASGGDDIPGLCLSGLQLALVAAPPSSEIFVFTDAPAKDVERFGAVTALIESSKSVVTFMLTEVTSVTHSLSQLDVQLYRELAQASGGQAIEVSTKSDLPQATIVIEDSLALAVVTLLQIVKSGETEEDFSFQVDDSMRSLTAYITGDTDLTFTLTNPSGSTQESTVVNGPLATISTVGNLRRISLSIVNQMGLWKITVDTKERFSLKVTGQSSVNFIYNLIEAHEGAHGGYNLKEDRPITGGNCNLLVSVTGSDTAKLTEVTLVEVSGSQQVTGSVQALGGGNYLVTFYSVPGGEFAVHARGEEGNGSTSSSTAASSSFQRQAPTQIKTASISISASASLVEPGSIISVPFTVANGVVTNVHVTNDQGYITSAPASVMLDTRGTVNHMVELTVPGTAARGSVVTLVVEADNGTTNNYAILRLSVAADVTDISGPVCQMTSISDTCHSSAALCSSTQWQYSTRLTDGANGAGIDSVSIRQGNGTLKTSQHVGAAGENVTMVAYNATCCALKVELVAVDKVGNVGTCTGQVILKQATAAVPTTSTAGRTLTLSQLLWIGVTVSHLWL